MKTAEEILLEEHNVLEIQISEPITAVRMALSAMEKYAGQFFTLEEMEHCFEKSREAFVFETPMRPTYKRFEDYMKAKENNFKEDTI